VKIIFGLFKVVQKHFYYKKKEIKEQCESWLKEMELHISDKQIGQSLLKSSTALKVSFKDFFVSVFVLVLIFCLF
jgi:hypothetical protein